MPTLLPRDDNGLPIQTLRFKSGGAQKITATSASSTRNSIAFSNDSRIIGLYATGAIYLKTGDTSVTASSSDHYFPAGVYYDFSLGGETLARHSHIAVRAVDADCIVYLSEKE